MVDTADCLRKAILLSVVCPLYTAKLTHSLSLLHTHSLSIRVCLLLQRLPTSEPYFLSPPLARLRFDDPVLVPRTEGNVIISSGKDCPPLPPNIFMDKNTDFFAECGHLQLSQSSDSERGNTAQSMAERKDRQPEPLTASPPCRTFLSGIIHMVSV